MTSNKAQVTIFVIVAIVVVVGIAASIFFIGGRNLISPTGNEPDRSVEGCVKESIEDKLQILLENGGEIKPWRTVSYLGENYTYLCYQADYYLPCYNLKPGLEKALEESLQEYTKADVQNCFDNFREDEESKGFDVSGGETSYSVDLVPGAVSVILQKDITVTDSDGSSQEFSNFDFKILSHAYDIISVSREIVNAEAEYCYFEYGGYMILHPEFHITKAYADESKVYVVEHTRTKEKFKFAVRSCAPKPGI